MVRTSLSDYRVISGRHSLKPWLGRSIQMDMCCLLFSKLPVRCCVVGMVNTLKVAACATVAGRALSVMFPPTSALISHAVAMGPASWELVSVTRGTKERTVKKVNVLNNVPQTCKIVCNLFLLGISKQ